MKNGKIGSGVGTLSMVLSLTALLGTLGRAEDLTIRPPPSGSGQVLANGCKTPSKLLTVPGFTLVCGKRIPAGIFLGSFLSPAASGLDDCVARCAANDKCLAFSLDNRQNATSRVCTLYGSTESYADAPDWVLGVRTTAQVVLPKPTASNADIHWLNETESKKPTIAMDSANQGQIFGGDNSVFRKAATHGEFTTYSNILHSKSLSEITGKQDIPGLSDSSGWADSSRPFDSKDATTDTPVALTPDMKGLQPVYFATDRTRKAEPLQQTSFTDEPTLDMTYGYAIVSIPKSHVIGNVERPKWRWLKLAVEPESDPDHFRIKALNALDRNALVEQLKGDADSVLLFVHGYNVSFSDAVFKAAQIAFDANFAGTVLVFSWPSAGDLFKYDKDRESAEFAAPHLAQIFHLVMEEIGKKNVYIVAHSMGNQVLVNALQQAALSKAKIAISELVMAAPDVDKNVFLSKADQIRAVAKNITLYASSADKALLASGEKSFGTRLGYVGPTGPNIFPGIEVIDVTAVGDDMLGLDHSTYSSSRAVLDDLGRLIRSLTHLPPDVRTPTLKYMPDKAHVQYWLYPR